MLVEQRTYTTLPGKVSEYLKLYEAEGLAIQTRILPRMLGYFYTEIGPLNQIIHMWGYADMAERSRKRQELGADPGWLSYVAKIRPLVIKQESRILIPAPFSPIR